MTAEPLKPCPFCSGPVEVWRDGGEVFIQCNKCGGRTGRFLHGVAAIAAWNRREPFGNSDELPSWLVEKIKNEIESQRNYLPTDFNSGCKLTLEWVLSLKKEENHGGSIPGTDDPDR